jgi:cephalosporin hydroxylase
MSLADEYDRAASTPSDFWEHVPFVAELVRHRKATTVIELGTRTGVSTAGWLTGLADTGGTLWSVDLEPRPALEVGDADWQFIQGDDLDPAVFAALPDADIVFIDTSHAYAQTLAELNLYRYKLPAGGCFVLHDTELARPAGVGPGPRFPVKTAIELFCQEQCFAWSNRPQNFGLGIIEVGPL